MTELLAPMAIQSLDPLLRARSHAARVEAGLDPAGQKLRGQFLTSMAVARVLAALSVRPGLQDVIDPMGGHGALLDAVLERTAAMGTCLRRVAAIEIDSLLSAACQERLSAWRELGFVSTATVQAASAFDPSAVSRLAADGFDLVITNPPYVRYQSTATGSSLEAGELASAVRDGLKAIAAERAPSVEQGLWGGLIQGYSGLADLSVPSWLLSALLVRPGGVLALVVPTTWRSRDYADVIRYVMQRCFRMECIVSDDTASWFPSALVRTELVVAVRLRSEEVAIPLHLRPSHPTQIATAEIATLAGNGGSLVGSAFGGDDPEGKFAQWLRSGTEQATINGVRARTIDSNHLFARQPYGRSVGWLAALEGAHRPKHLKLGSSAREEVDIPELLAPLVPESAKFRSLRSYGIEVGQGLRTGCNDFFYVDFVEPTGRDESRVRVSPLLGGAVIRVPNDAVLPTLRRQSELAEFTAGRSSASRILDLHGYVLPEDLPIALQHRGAYSALHGGQPRVMPPELAEHVRLAAGTKYGSRSILIPELSAVATNARSGPLGSKATPPRFWYQLPSFANRHRPNAFVARVNTGTPSVFVNLKTPVLVDANFSTFWRTERGLSAKVLVALLNSTWARTCMETMGTVLGGGALKLEATHLRRLPLPHLSAEELGVISALLMNRSGRLTEEAHATVDRIMFLAVLGPKAGKRRLQEHGESIRGIAERSRLQRQFR